MHLHVPESRDKTVSSLLAASAREMLRPGRGAQQQYIVKTFSANNVNLTYSSFNRLVILMCLEND